jgi:FAD/FMN-containing dehydrogenase
LPEFAPRPGDLSRCLRDWSGPTPVLVRSGGTSSRCRDPALWSLDLRTHCRELQLSADGHRVRVGAGVTMAELQRHLALAGRSVPTGLSGLPGAGYLLTGGISPLSRSQGLAIDRILALEGVWADGEPLALTAEQSLEADGHGSDAWRGLLGAAPFLAVVSAIELSTTPRQPLQIARALVSPEQLAEWIQRAETWPDGVCLQWYWADQIEILLVAIESDEASAQAWAACQPHLAHLPGAVLERIDGLEALPPFGSLARTPRQRMPVAQEVLGLVSPAWEAATPALIQVARQAMAQRPDPGCALASQQLGGATARVPATATSFVHRQAIWKPWITAAWPAADPAARQRSLTWLLQLRDQLRPYCPGVHLAQLHDHLPWHRWELEAAFGDWLPGLRRLKAQHDRHRLLPGL